MCKKASQLESIKEKYRLRCITVYIVQCTVYGGGVVEDLARDITV